MLIVGPRPGVTATAEARSGDMSRRLLLPAVVAALAGVALSTPVAHADESIATTAEGLELRADAGSLVWLARTGSRYRFVAASESALPATPPKAVGASLPAEVSFDVGADRGGRAAIVWTTGCSTRTHRCDVRTLPAAGGTARLLTRIPYTGGDAPAVSLSGARIAYTVAEFRGSGKRRQQCDRSYVRTLTGTARPATPRRVASGGCAAAYQLDLEGPWLASLVSDYANIYAGGCPTEVRVARTSGRGTARKLQRETQGEESNYVDAIALDGGRVYTARAGIRQKNVFRRYDPATGRFTEANAFVSLAGGFARDAGRAYYVEGASGDEVECTGGDGIEPCHVVAGSDPWAGPRVLTPVVTLATAPDIAYVDGPMTLSGTVTRARVDRTRTLATVPQAGVPIALDSARVTGQTSFSATGRTTTTGGDGAWSVRLDPPLAAGVGYRARAGEVTAATSAVPKALYPPVYAHLDARSATRSGGTVTVTGTIAPAQPGRKVVLQRRVARRCGLNDGLTTATPSTVETPKGCFDDFRPQGSAVVSADGRAFSISANGGGAVYRVVLDFARGGGVAGETTQLTVP